MLARSARFGAVAVVALLALAPSIAGGEESEERPELTIGVVPQRAYGDSDTRAMTTAGISSVRFWMSWQQVESQRGKFDWGTVDQTVATNAKAGLTTLPYLFGTPQWAAALDGWACVPETCASFAPRTPDSRQAFAEFAGAAVRRYGPDGAFWRQHRELPARPIRTWQIWNEPNLSSFYNPNVDPQSYGLMVQAVGAAIHVEDPNAQILLGGLTGTETNFKRMSSARFLNLLYGVPGIEDAFDGIAVHPYSRYVGGTMAQVRQARKIAEAHGDDPGIWISELGWASAGKRRWGLVKTPMGQARLLGRALEELDANAESLDIRAIYWYAWRDTDEGQAVCGWCPWSGLIDRVGRQKLSYMKLRAFSEERD